MMESLHLHYYGDPILRQKGKPIADFNKEISDMANAMIYHMGLWEGCGLAAQQVGYPLQLFVMDFSFLFNQSIPNDTLIYDNNPLPFQFLTPLVVINPELTPIKGGPLKERKEGCLSFPTVSLPIERYEHVKMRFQDCQMQVHVLEVSGIIARIIQHEYDHLNGVLFIDHLKPLDRRQIETKLKQIKRGKLR